MKYIRIKDGIYEVVDIYETKYVVGYTEDGFEKVVYKENIIAESDTIEELCDVFVVKYEDCGIVCDSLNWAKARASFCNEKKIQFMVQFGLTKA